MSRAMGTTVRAWADSTTSARGYSSKEGSAPMKWNVRVRPSGCKVAPINRARDEQ